MYSPDAIVCACTFGVECAETRPPPLLLDAAAERRVTLRRVPGLTLGTRCEAMAEALTVPLLGACVAFAVPSWMLDAALSVLGGSL